MLSGGGVRIELKDFQPIHDKCATSEKEDERCNKICDEPELGYRRCSAYVNPSYWWDHRGHCPLASHVSLSEKDTEQGKKRVGQLKQKSWYGRK